MTQWADTEVPEEQTIMQIKVKLLHKRARIPFYATQGAACFDLQALLAEPVSIAVGKPVVVPTGLAFEIPEGYVMLIFSRSGNGFKNDTRLANCVGVIDADYRGEVMVKLTRDMSMTQDLVIYDGDRIAQAMLVPIPKVGILVVDELGGTARGVSGFGSTGK